MIITIRDSKGVAHKLEIEPQDPVSTVKAKYEEITGIPADDQHLLYGGKLLEDYRLVGDYYIPSRATLDVLNRRRGNSPSLEGRSSVPRESIFPSYSEAQEVVDKWKALAEKGEYDADTHIVDPEAHYQALDSLARETIALSELYRCSGTYRLDDGLNPLPSLELTRVRPAPEWFHQVLLDLEYEKGTNPTVVSLCKTYLIILSLQHRLGRLTSRGFSKSFFSILLERADESVAEIVQIPMKSLLDLASALEVAIGIANQGSTPSEDEHEVLVDCIMPTIHEFFLLIDCPQLIDAVMNVRTPTAALHLCRVVAWILDLGLVCYVGSHAARFDLDHFPEIAQPWSFHAMDKLCFDCSLRTLACLHGFLDARSVWVFRIGFSLPLSSERNKNRKPISILTTIDALSDIWGPVWAEAVDRGGDSSRPQLIKKYHVSKGCIRRVREGPESAVPGIVKCHWYSWVEDHRRRFSTLFQRSEDLYMSLDDKLLIGTALSVKAGCTYTFQEYEMNYSDTIRSLGPKPSSWKFDGIAAAVQVAAPKVITFQIQGEVKKVPETTVKQSIWQKWSFNPERANPGVLNNYFGVEISHCTGNARRVPLKQILLMPPVQELLEQQIPAWTTKPWGVAFQKALQTESNDAIFEFWSRYKEERVKAGQLVCCVLELLDTTGKTDFGLHVAFVHQNRELGVDLDYSKNEWAGLLKDTYITAAYVIVNHVCLECRRPDHTTSICGDESRYTVLQTEIGLKKGSQLKHRLKIEPHSQTFKSVDDNHSRGGAYHITPESSIRRTLSLSHGLAAAKELLLQDPERHSNQSIKLILHAPVKSYGGMSYTRDRTILSRSVDDDPVDVASLAAMQDGLSQMELEAIIEDQKNPYGRQGGRNAIF